MDRGTAVVVTAVAGGPTIAGQLAAAATVDHLGLLGVERQPLSAVRVAGIALLGAGVFLVVRD